jgi:hypothetical protein
MEGFRVNAIASDGHSGFTYIARLGQPALPGGLAPLQAERISFHGVFCASGAGRPAYHINRTKAILQTNINKNPTNPQSKRLIRLPHPLYRRAIQDATSEHPSPRDRHLRLQSAAFGATLQPRQIGGYGTGRNSA